MTGIDIDHNGRMVTDIVLHMARHNVTMTIDAEVLGFVDEDAAAAGLNRSQYVEEVLRRDHWSRFWRNAAGHRARLTEEQRAELAEHERLAAKYAEDIHREQA